MERLIWLPLNIHPPPAVPPSFPESELKVLGLTVGGRRPKVEGKIFGYLTCPPSGPYQWLREEAFQLVECGALVTLDDLRYSPPRGACLLSSREPATQVQVGNLPPASSSSLITGIGEQGTAVCGRATGGWCITKLPMPSQHTGVAVEGKLVIWLLGTGVQRRGEATAERACLGKSWVWRNFLTLGRVILDNRCMVAINIWDVVLLLCLLCLAR